MAFEVYGNISAETMAKHEWVKYEDHLAEMRNAEAMFVGMRNRCASMEGALMASERLRAGNYPPWLTCGGPNECKHGIAKGIDCAGCDLETVRAQSLI